MTDRTYPDRPFLAVSAAIIKDGKVLLVRRANPPMHGLYTFPGGVVEAGETLEEALHRLRKASVGPQRRHRLTPQHFRGSCLCLTARTVAMAGEGRATCEVRALSGDVLTIVASNADVPDLRERVAIVLGTDPNAVRLITADGQELGNYDALPLEGLTAAAMVKWKATCAFCNAARPGSCGCLVERCDCPRGSMLDDICDRCSAWPEDAVPVARAWRDGRACGACGEVRCQCPPQDDVKPRRRRAKCSRPKASSIDEDCWQ